MLSNELTWLSDGRGRLIWCNPAWLAYTGYAPDPEGADAQGWVSVVHPGDREALACALRSGQSALRLTCRLREEGSGVHRPLDIEFSALGVDGLPADGPLVVARATVSASGTTNGAGVEDLERMVSRLREAVAHAGEVTGTMSEFAMRVESGIHAFRCAELVRRGAPGGVDLAFFVAECLGAGSGLADPRVTIEGPDTGLVREALHPLSAVLDTLQFESLVRGALCDPEGRLVVRWSPAHRGGGGGGVVLSWQETTPGSTFPGAAEDPAWHDLRRSALARAWRSNGLPPLAIEIETILDGHGLLVRLALPEEAIDPLGDGEASFAWHDPTGED